MFIPSCPERKRHQYYTIRNHLLINNTKVIINVEIQTIEVRSELSKKKYIIFSGLS